VLVIENQKFNMFHKNYLGCRMVLYENGGFMIGESQVFLSLILHILNS